MVERWIINFLSQKRRFESCTGPFILFFFFALFRSFDKTRLRHAKIGQIRRDHAKQAKHVKKIPRFLRVLQRRSHARSFSTLKFSNNNIYPFTFLRMIDLFPCIFHSYLTLFPSLCTILPLQYFTLNIFSFSASLET